MKTHGVMVQRLANREQQSQMNLEHRYGLEGDVTDEQSHRMLCDLAWWSLTPSWCAEHLPCSTTVQGRCRTEP